MKRQFPWLGFEIWMGIFIGIILLSVGWLIFRLPEMLPEPKSVTPEEQKRLEEEYPYYEMLFWEGRDPGFSGM